VKLLLYDTGQLSLTYNLADNILVKVFVILHSSKFAPANFCIARNNATFNLGQIKLLCHCIENGLAHKAMSDDDY